MLAQPLSQARRKICHCRWVTDHGGASAQLKDSSQGEWAAYLKLRRTLIPLEAVLNGVQVFAQQGLGTAQVSARAHRYPPRASFPLGRQVDEDGSSSAGQLRPGAPVRELGDMWKVRKCIEDQRGSGACVVPGHGPDPGGYAREVHAVAVMVAEPRTQVPSYSASA